MPAELRSTLPSSPAAGAVAAKSRAALLRGDRTAARRLAFEALGLDRQCDLAWLVLAALSPADRRRAYLEHAASLCPESARLRKALAETPARPRQGAGFGANACARSIPGSCPACLGADPRRTGGALRPNTLGRGRAHRASCAWSRPCSSWSPSRTWPPSGSSWPAAARPAFLRSRPPRWSRPFARSSISSPTIRRPTTWPRRTRRGGAWPARPSCAAPPCSSYRWRSPRSSACLSGVWAATRNRRSGSALIITLSILGVSTPSFLLAMLFWIADFKIYRLTGTAPFPPTGFGWDLHMVMPALVLATRPMAQVAQVTYVTLSEALSQDYMRTALGQGAQPRRRGVAARTPQRLDPRADRHRHLAAFLFGQPAGG